MEKGYLARACAGKSSRTRLKLRDGGWGSNLQRERVPSGVYRSVTSESLLVPPHHSPPAYMHLFLGFLGSLHASTKHINIYHYCTVGTQIPNSIPGSSPRGDRAPVPRELSDLSGVHRTGGEKCPFLDSLSVSEALLQFLRST